jgi:hypothetical protein
MTPQELAEFRELAGVNEISTNNQNTQWANGQVVSRVQPLPLEAGVMGYDGAELKMSKLLNFSPSSHSQDPNLDGLANRLNSLLGSDDFKVERLK